jgi:hypothetical protein
MLICVEICGGLTLRLNCGELTVGRAGLERGSIQALNLMRLAPSADSVSLARTVRRRAAGCSATLGRRSVMLRTSKPFFRLYTTKEVQGIESQPNYVLLLHDIEASRIMADE